MTVAEDREVREGLDGPKDTPATGSSIGFLSLLVHRRKTVAAFTAAGALIGIALALVLPAEFESSAELMPPDQSGSSTLMSALASRGADIPAVGLSGLFGIKSSGALFIGVLQSRSAQDDLVAKFNLQKQYHKATMEKTRKKLQSRSFFSEDRKTGLITIAVRDESRDRARLMCQEYIDILDRLMEQDSSSAARSEREFLENRLALAGNELEDTERQYSQFASSNKAVDIPEETKATVDAAATLQGQLVAAEAQLNGLRQIYAPDNVSLLATEGRVATLRSKLHELAGKASDGDDQGSELISPSLEQLPKLGVTYADLYRELKIQESLYSTLTTEYELAKVEEAKDTPKVRVLDPPNLPGKRAAPQIILLLIGSVFFALLFGCLWVIVRDWWQALDPDDAKRRLALSVVDAVRADFRRPLSIFGKTGPGDE